MRKWLLFGLIVLASACTNAGETAPSTTVTTTIPAATTTIGTSDDACRSGNLPFADSGLAAAIGEDKGDATTITQIRWDGTSSCERLTVVLASDSGAPAGNLGATAVFVDASTGIVRIQLPDEVTTTATADMLTEGDVIDRVFVARSEDGAMTIDLHSPPGQSVAARAFVTEGPATLVVDVIAGPQDSAPTGATVSDSAVVVAPLAGPTVYPFTIEGYAAPGLSSIVVQVRDGSQVISDRTISLVAFSDTWQQISIVVEDGPPGVVDLFVGSADGDGDPAAGASIRLDLP